MSTNINAFLARRNEEKEAPKKAANAQKGYITKDEKKKKYFAPKADKESFRVIVPTATGNHYEEAFFHEISAGGVPQQYYCLSHNDGKPCPLCDEQARLKALSKAEVFGSDESKVLYKASLAYEPRKFYIFKGISRGHLSDGIKFWRIKENFKKTGAMDKIDSELSDYAEVHGEERDFADVMEGSDFQIKTIEQAKTLGSGTYREISSIKLIGPKKLDDDEAEITKLQADSMTWKDIYTPIAVNGHLDEYQFLQAVVAGRAPLWDKAISKWILTDEQGNQYAAEYARQDAGKQDETPVASKQDETPVTSKQDVTPNAKLVADPAPVVVTQPALAPSVIKKPTPVKKAIDPDDLPF